MDVVELDLAEFLSAPVGECNRCHRKVWDRLEVGLEDRLTQPDGNPCGGRFTAL